MRFKINFSFLLLPGRRFSKDSEVQETEEPCLSRLHCTRTCFSPWILRLGESFERRNVFLRLGEICKNYMVREWTEAVLKHVHKVFDILKRVYALPLKFGKVLTVYINRIWKKWSYVTSEARS